MTSLVMTDPMAAYHDPTLAQALRSELAVLETKIKERSATLQEGLRANEAGGNTNVDWLQKNVVKLKTKAATLTMELGDAVKKEGEAVSTVVFDRIDLPTSLPESERFSNDISDLLQTYPALKEK